ncbi:MAG TPA: DUF6178 family protein [Anaeromyxobacteraceae bacterium]|nr:DUF6178 family protein [Anaeromyxobacteraceae bacterium]
MAKGEREKAIAGAELARARTGLAAARGRRRLDLLLEARDPGALVRALPADELYFTIRDIGLADAHELVRLASPRQFQAFLDLDAWSLDRFDPARALAWFRAARAGPLADPGAAARWARKLAALDAEVLYLVLRSSVHVHDLGEDPDPVIQSDRFLRTPEGKFVVEFTVEGAEYAAVKGMVDDLVAEDPFQATRLLSALRWEMPSELEESALRWRTGRLADLGFPPLEEALSWFARPPPGPALPPGRPERPPGFFLAEFRGGSLLDRAAARLDPDDRETVEVQVLAAANAVIVADGLDPGDLEALRARIEGARATIERGLERLAGPDEEAAARVLAGTPVKRIFQEGFGRVLELSWRAGRIFEEGGAGSREAPLLDPPLGEAMAALSSRRPRYFPGLAMPRAEWGTPASAAHEPRSFLSSAEVAQAAEALDLCEGLAALARRLGVAPARTEGPLPPRLSACYLTALANERLGQPFAPEPIPAAALPEVLRRLEPLEDFRLAAEGEPGRLLLELARRRLGELAPVREGAAVRPEVVTALLLR